jgi:hypothetical protein
MFKTAVEYLNVTEGYEAFINTWQFVDNIPKRRLFVKLNPTITSSETNLVANGIRNFFNETDI